MEADALPHSSHSGTTSGVQAHTTSTGDAIAGVPRSTKAQGAEQQQLPSDLCSRCRVAQSIFNEVALFPAVFSHPRRYSPSQRCFSPSSCPCHVVQDLNSAMRSTTDSCILPGRAGVTRARPTVRSFAAQTLPISRVIYCSAPCALPVASTPGLHLMGSFFWDQESRFCNRLIASRVHDQGPRAE